MDKVAQRVITIRQTCERYGIGRTKLYELLGEGRIEAVKLGKRTLVFTSSADQFFSGLPAFTSAKYIIAD